MRSLRTYAVAAAAAVLMILGVACAARARGYQVPFGGFLVYRSGGITSLWRASWPGQRAGLRVRDVVTAVDGEPVSGGPEIARALARHQGDGSIRLTVRGPGSWFWPGSGSVTRTVRVPLGRLGPWDLAYTFWLPFSIGILYLLLGALLYGLKPSRESALASALCLLAAAFYLTMFDAHTTWRYTRVWLSYPLLGPLSVHFFSLFPEKRPAWARARSLGPLYLAAAVVIAWRQWAIDDPTASDQGARISSIVLSLEFTVDLGLLGYTMLRGSSPAVRNRAKSIFIGLGLTCGASVAWQFASRIGPPHLTMTADQAMVLSAMFPVLITYAIVTRDLFDIDAVLRASLSWGLASAFVLGLYAAVVLVLGNVAARLAGHSTAIVVGSTLCAALLFHPARLRAQRIAIRRFRPSCSRFCRGCPAKAEWWGSPSSRSGPWRASSAPAARCSWFVRRVSRPISRSSGGWGSAAPACSRCRPEARSSARSSSGRGRRRSAICPKTPRASAARSTPRSWFRSPPKGRTSR